MGKKVQEPFFNLPVPDDVANIMEDRRGRVEGTIDEEGNYHDKYKGDRVIGKRNDATQSFEYSWNL